MSTSEGQDPTSALLREQIQYYRARAAEYDEWFLRRGRYYRGDDHREEWFREAAIARSALVASRLTGDVLELACGTGFWTVHLARSDARVVALDGSLETIAINRRHHLRDVAYVVGDVFALPLARMFDAIFFSFWLSHVPAARFDEFWDVVAAALKPGGRVFFIDNLAEPTSSARDHGPIDDSGISRRRLNDGRRFQVVKIFHRPAELGARLRALGWEADVRPTGRFFYYGTARRV